MSLGELFAAVFLLILVSIPLALSVWALLDAAHRPRWVWALAEKNQVAWMAAILIGALALVVGLVVSLWYLLRVRPTLAAIEAGKLE